jgi:hypothetical protein
MQVRNSKAAYATIYNMLTLPENAKEGLAKKASYFHLGCSFLQGSASLGCGTRTAGCALLRCGVLGASTCACPRSTEPGTYASLRWLVPGSGPSRIELERYLDGVKSTEGTNQVWISVKLLYSVRLEPLR